MKIDKEFKRALSKLPDSEKDKLIAMLVRRDKKLAKRLHYELIGDFTKEDLQNDFYENVTIAFENVQQSHFKPISLSRALRKLSSEIASYLFTTKDKYGEVLLNLYLMNKTFEYFSDEVNTFSGTDKGRKLAVYIINKTFNLRIAINKLDPDLYIDFQEDLTKLGRYFEKNNGIVQTSKYHGFDIDWLLEREVPENIELIQKDLRRRGFLK
jgi:predicted unusual protein kinase regulating ubiquinone biosynthesis (AarF/ABC1/UbiB family)